MQVNSRSDLPAIAFKHWWTDDAEVGIVVMKATFGGLGTEPATLLREQPPLLTYDVFRAGPHDSSPVAESDLAPHKPRTDLTVAAVARAPEGASRVEWTVRVAVAGRLDVSFQVTGPRMWEKEGRAWRLAPPEPVLSVPVCYELAYGGTAPDADGASVIHPYNPVGRGLTTALTRAASDPIAAPQIGLMAELASAAPDRPMAVCGAGPIGRAWLPRRGMAGTFDAAWRAARSPRMPLDYSFAYWNAAPTTLQLSPWLVGDETIALHGLRHDPRPMAVALPGMEAFLRVLRPEGPSPASAMALDTVAIDIENADPALHTATLVWRGWFRDPGRARSVETIVRRRRARAELAA